MRQVAVNIVKELGELVVDQLPKFIRPVQDLVDYVSNLFNTIKTNIMDFYKVSIQALCVFIILNIY